MTVKKSDKSTKPIDANKSSHFVACFRLLGECSLENIEELILSNANHLTAVSVQLLAENCPKLRVLGSLTSWDVTPEELDALRILIALSNTDLTLWPITF